MRGEESVASIRRLAPTDIPTGLCRATAWDDYDVPVAPFFVLIDGASGDVIGEGAANEWEPGAVAAAHRARRRRACSTGKGNVKARSVGQARGPTRCARRAPIATCSPPASAPATRASTRCPAPTFPMPGSGVR